jgi:hypothetical protein
VPQAVAMFWFVLSVAADMVAPALHRSKDLLLHVPLEDQRRSELLELVVWCTLRLRALRKRGSCAVFMCVGHAAVGVLGAAAISIVLTQSALVLSTGVAVSAVIRQPVQYKFAASVPLLLATLGLPFYAWCLLPAAAAIALGTSFGILGLSLLPMTAAIAGFSGFFAALVAGAVVGLGALGILTPTWFLLTAAGAAAALLLPAGGIPTVLGTAVVGASTLLQLSPQTFGVAQSLANNTVNHANALWFSAASTFP